ncbi:arrestin domain-containing protein 17 [Cephus cinctus]|uniref:Arrestin domain-containing protein 17 n=1 Tax=Cephus cinctus TaxID=211228 RepID=A0AAJ7C422_CEPCN|nr:arrestin domain-containing protein 17 [Cephus cinctus]
MALKDFKILFDNPWSTYYSGQTVTGRILLLLDRPKKLRGINVKAKGVANTCWSSDKQELNNEGRYENETQTVTGHEEYFNIQYYVLGSFAGSEIELPAGEHKYQFSVTLPPDLPSSFESDFGHVRYTVKAILDRPWKFDQETKVAFTVVSSFDLNQEPKASEPIQEEMSKTFCCLCCGSQPLTVKVSIPIRGYVPGQRIPIRVNLENHSNVVVDTMKFILLKMVTFHADTPRTESKSEELVVVEIAKGPVRAGDNAMYEQELEVPPLPPSNLSNCRIIDLEYNLKMEACVSGWYHRNLKKNILVFIGTVPLLNYQGSTVGYPSISPSAPKAPSSSEAHILPPLQPMAHLYPSLPPPSYEDSVYSVKSLRERDESEYIFGLRSHFAPKYPVYTFTPQQ